MIMSQLYTDHSLLLDDHDWQEEPSVTIRLVPLCPSVPRTSADDEAEEVEGQEESHAANTSSTSSKTQEHAGPASTGSVSHGPVSKPL
ncbi:hypothetical protein Y1Q_0000939 [Alligator mississippiensis]|uniref:Uncharacterized protein n=1 Tax=Alligator mississippiensis TaxID=8496 RepID=A0A151NDZ4_ALLMI|nr:hypothetical protein Y1Q_0000939 [Alligator mississippiensis]